MSRHSIVSAPYAVLLLLCTAALLVSVPGQAIAQDSQDVNLAVAAQVSTSYVSGHETLEAVRDGYDPRHSNDRRHGQYGNWPRRGTQWVQYQWDRPISTNKIDVYWWNDQQGVRTPRRAGCSIGTAPSSRPSSRRKGWALR